MQLFKVAARAFSSLTLAGLAACGGGGGDGAGSAPSNTLQVEIGTGSLPNGRYAFDTNYSDASGSLPITGHVIEFVWPENSNFDSGIVFARDDVRKYMIGLSENSPSNARYGCVSTAWTSGELAQVFNDADIPSLPKCSSLVLVSIDAASHRIAFNNLHLVDLNGSAKSVTFSLDAGWRLQNAALSGSGGSTSGSTSPISTSGSVSMSGGSMVTTVSPAVTPTTVEQGNSSPP